MRVNHVLMHNEMCGQFAMHLRLVIDERKRELEDLQALLVSVTDSGNPSLDLDAVITNDDVAAIRDSMRGRREEPEPQQPAGGTLTVQPKGQLTNGQSDTADFIQGLHEARDKAAREAAENGPKDLDAVTGQEVDEEHTLARTETGA